MQEQSQPEAPTDRSLRDSLMAAFERIATEPHIDWYLAFKLIRANIGLTRDTALDDALAKAMFALDVRNTAICAECVRLLDAPAASRRKRKDG
jgi:hypothetical protein